MRDDGCGGAVVGEGGFGELALIGGWGTVGESVLNFVRRAAERHVFIGVIFVSGTPDAVFGFVNVHAVDQHGGGNRMDSPVDVPKLRVADDKRMLGVRA